MPHCNAIYLRVFLFQFKTAKLQLHRRKSKLNRPKAAKAAETRKTVESSGKCKITTFFGRTRILEIFIKRRKHKRQTGLSGIRVGKCCLFVEAMTACVVSLSHDASCRRKRIQARIRGRPTNVVNNSYKQKKLRPKSQPIAERQGFEPWVRIAVQRFSRPPRSSTPASFLKRRCKITLFFIITNHNCPKKSELVA